MLHKISQPWSQTMEKQSHTSFQNNRSANTPLRHHRPDYKSLTVRMRTYKQREIHFKTVSIKDKRLANQQKGPSKEIL